jgi:hypothetical protein
MAGAERGVRAWELLVIAAGSGTEIKTRPDPFGLVDHLPRVEAGAACRNAADGIGSK